MPAAERPDWVSNELFPFESRFFDTPDGQRMHYVDEGSGAPVVFVHVERWQSALSDARLLTFEDCGHSSPRRRPSGCSRRSASSWRSRHLPGSASRPRAERHYGSCYAPPRPERAARRCGLANRGA